MQTENSRSGMHWGGGSISSCFRISGLIDLYTIGRSYIQSLEEVRREIGKWFEKVRV